jgi:hypothetical protein
VTVVHQGEQPSGGTEVGFALQQDVEDHVGIEETFTGTSPRDAGGSRLR